MGTPAVEIQKVSKYFAKVVANKDVSISVEPGEVVALLGENGAGKSTIMKILYGLYSKDEGKIFIRGEEMDIHSPKDAMSHGIAMIQQHFSLVPVHTATENIILGNVHGTISLKKYNQEIQALAEKYDFNIPVDRPVGELAVGVQQKVEILKALYMNASILIMDEPTAVLTPQEADNLLEFIQNYAAQGNSVIFITHKMKEVMAVANKIVIMRSGVVVDTVRREDVDEHILAQKMMGHDVQVDQPPQKLDYTTLKPVLEVKDLTLQRKGFPNIIDHVSFDVYGGEVFGIAGVSGNGQDELCQMLAGAMKPSSGEVIFNGENIVDKDIRYRIESGMGYVPVDRYRDGMVADMTLAENMMLKSSFGGRWVKNGILQLKALQAYTEDMLKEHYVKATGHADLARSLSGGNQQKVVLAREVDLGSKMIIFNQPIRGLDMGAVDRIHKVISQQRQAGKAVLLVSTELSEIFEMCNRIAVMYKGRFMGIYSSGELDVQRIGLLMAGVEEGEKNETK